MKRPPRLLPWLTLLLVGACATACSPGLTLDGRPFTVASCRSGQPWGFRGVDLTDAEGRRVFVAWTQSSGARVSLFDDKTNVVELGHCGDIDAETTRDLAEPEAVTGHFDVSCSANGHTFSGGYRFRDCR